MIRARNYKDTLKEVYEILEEVRALETLEYHNKNHLAFDNSKRSVHKIVLLTHAINALETYVKRTTYF